MIPAEIRPEEQVDLAGESRIEESFDIVVWFNIFSNLTDKTLE